MSILPASSVRAVGLAFLLAVTGVFATATWASAAPSMQPPNRATASSSSFTRGAGLLPKLQHLGSTKMRVVVPKLPCSAKTRDSSITIGMFGSLHGGRAASHGWFVAVRMSCKGGHRHASAGFNGFGDGLKIHPGDVLVLSQQGGSEYEVDDRTTGDGVGGASALPPGQQQHPSPHVLFGGRLTGRLHAPITVSVTNAEVHGKPLGKRHWVGQQQKRKNGKVIGDPGPLSKDGRRFPVTFG